MFSEKVNGTNNATFAKDSDSEEECEQSRDRSASVPLKNSVMHDGFSTDKSLATVLKSSQEDWNDLEKEYVQLEEEHKKYCNVLQTLSASQQKCLAQIKHHRYRIKFIMENISKAKTTGQTEELKKQAEDLSRKVAERKLAFHEMEENLPHKNGLYLSIILGQVNVSLLTKEAKFIYKKDYEKFKLTVSYIILSVAFACYTLIDSRWCDAALNFLLVWYYCTLTIRESILKVNGSRIKGWWVTHHFISTVCAGISLIWSDSYTYQEFRNQHLLFVIYISFVYVLQYYYQSGSLYRLRSLGEGHEMDITVEGFMSWMWKGLSFLLPFLFIGYIFQLYNAYVLFNLTYHPQCLEWQVPALGIINLILFTGNTSTTLTVVASKIHSDGIQLSYLRQKYRFMMSNYFSQGHGHAE